MRWLQRELFGPIWHDVHITLPLVLLALLLFAAAMSTPYQEIRDAMQRPLLLLFGLAGVWVGPVLLVAVVGSFFRETLPPGVLVGLVLVASMPVANSSVGWSHNARGNLALSLGLILFSISLSPWVTPAVLRLLGFSLSVTEQTYTTALVSRFSGKFFIVWVILPTLVGFVCR